MSDENILVNPKDLEKQDREEKVKKLEQRREQAQKRREELGQQELELNETKFHNRGGTVRILYETQGRFSIPRELYFEDFNTKHVNDLTLSREEELLENLTTILNDVVNQDAGVDVGDMLPEEFLESLVGIKMQFNTELHEHTWYCDCQRIIPDELKKYNTSVVNLKELEYKSIIQVETELRERFKEQLEACSAEEYKEYLKKKYRGGEIDVDKWTIDEEVNSIELKEPFDLIDGEDIYSFRFMRIKDVIKAQRMARDIYDTKIKEIGSRRMNVSKTVQKAQENKGQNSELAKEKREKQRQIEKLREQQQKDTILFARAFTMVSKNGEPLVDEHKIKLYSVIKRDKLLDLSFFMDEFDFGISTEMDFTCSLCGEVQRRSLRKELNPIELLPLDTDTERKQRKSRSINIFVGV